LEDAFYLSNR